VGRWQRSDSKEGGRHLISSLLTLLGLAGVVAGFVLTALTRARKLGGSWEDRGLWAIFGGFGLIMVALALAVATSA